MTERRVNLDTGGLPAQADFREGDSPPLTRRPADAADVEQFRASLAHLRSGGHAEVASQPQFISPFSLLQAGHSIADGVPHPAVPAALAAPSSEDTAAWIASRASRLWVDADAGRQVHVG
jgi:hypothetical protein